MGSRTYSNVEPRTKAWAQVDVGLQTLRGDLVAFDQRIAVVKVATADDVPIGRAVWLVLGLEGEQAARVAASVVESREANGARLLSFELTDLDGAGRRRHPRVPFTERIEVIGITDIPGQDPRWRGHAHDLSIQGIGATLPTEIRSSALTLVRFPLPPHRAPFQVRAVAKNCEREAADSFRVGFLFERVTAGHVQQLHAAIVHLARAG